LQHWFYGGKEVKCQRRELAWNSSHQTGSTEWLPLSSMDTLAKILDLVEDAVICAGGEQQIVLFNDGAERVFGYSAGEVLGRPLSLLLPSHFAPDHEPHIVSARPPQEAGGKPERHEIFAYRKDGEGFQAEASIGTFQTDDGRIFAVILRETTQQKEVDEALPARLADNRRALSEIPHSFKDNGQFTPSRFQSRPHTILPDEVENRKKLLSLSLHQEGSRK
jgi:PAS domain S-box-containing protein